MAFLVDAINGISVALIGVVFVVVAIAVLPPGHGSPAQRAADRGGS